MLVLSVLEIQLDRLLTVLFLLFSLHNYCHQLFHLFLVELKVVYRNKQGMQYYGDGSKPIEPSQLWGEQKGRMAA